MTLLNSPAYAHVPPAEHMPISLRAYVTADETPRSARAGAGAAAARRPDRRPSQWTLIFDTETTVDAAQRLRFGVYQVREGDRLRQAGIFYNSQALEEAELHILRRFAVAHNLSMLTLVEFIEEIFFPVGYDDEATIVGFNLPFDISRIAIGHASARGHSRGGFSFKLSMSSRRARVQVKHLSARASLIRFTHPGEQLTPRGMRRRAIPVRPHRGFFVDIKTLAAALTSQSHSLESLGKFLSVTHQKHQTAEHGLMLTETYLAYAVTDVQTTWECYKELLASFNSFQIRTTPAHAIKSEAGLGKAYLREMGIRSWRQVQPDFPPEIIGQIMSTYYGGRSEIRIRRKSARILYSDFLSMYPTVCTLMGLWQFVIADGMDWHDSTTETKALLDRLSITDLQKPDFWPLLSTLVLVKPQQDIFPIRAQFGTEPQSTIGLNHLSSPEPIWFTLADCIASRLLTGRAPEVLRANTFSPNKPQTGLEAVNLSGNSLYRVDPVTQDFYRTVIDKRQAARKAANMEKSAGRILEASQLETEQLALKILANSTSYGIFVEVVVEELDRKVDGRCYGGAGPAFSVQTQKLEKPGAYFHPLLATLITGAARLLLASAECLARNAGINWAFCDTDSMAFAQPAGMADEAFIDAAKRVRSWFDPLNPYETKGELLKFEQANFGDDGCLGAPLYCYAVSAKRYALFNVDDVGRPVIRKASAHGLGHLLSPYEEHEAPQTTPAPSSSLVKIGVARWQYDLWYQIISASLKGHPNRPELNFHPGLNLPAISRYGATTPAILGWLKPYNQSRTYDAQVRPFGFLTALQAGTALDAQSEQPLASGKQSTLRLTSAKPISPYHRSPAQAAAAAFDRRTGQPVSSSLLKTYAQTLAQYHLHPEAKFLNGDFVDQGETHRRHVLATGFSFIGKEANRLEEQIYLGLTGAAIVAYGAAPDALPRLREQVAARIMAEGQHRVARAAHMSLRDVGRAARADDRIRPKLLLRLNQVLVTMMATGGQLSPEL